MGLPSTPKMHGYGIRPYGSPVRAKQHSALVRAYCDKIGAVLAVIVTLQMVRLALRQYGFHHFNPKFSNRLLKWGL